MIRTFGSISPYFKVDHKAVSIDNLVFKLHYRWTFLLLVVCTILVTSRQYIGEHIRCIKDSNKIPDHVINTFCFFTTTFTVIRHLNETALAAGAVPHPGIGPVNLSEDPIKHHAYYQWVPFVLFGQALFFYFPHILWKNWEGGRIRALVQGLKNVHLSKYWRAKKTMNFTDFEIAPKDEVDGRVKLVGMNFIERLSVNVNWGRELIFCEFLNFFNIMLQVHFTNRFLGGQFYRLGWDVMSEDWLGHMDVLDVIFPKVTKCHFHKFGPSGTLELNDALCIMALNVMNEKIYTFLWFWFFMLFVVSFLALVWRMVTVVFHSSSSTFNANIFSYASPGRLNRHHIEVVTQHCSFANWMFLYYLASNMDSRLFRKVLSQLAEEFCPESGDEGDEEAIQHWQKYHRNYDDEEEENQVNHIVESRNSSYIALDTIDTVDGIKIDRNKQ